MAKGKNQKLKLMYIMDYLLDKTDENHEVTCAQIIEELKRNDIDAERKSIYSDLELLRTYGVDIVGNKRGRDYYYKVVSRDFEIAELKLLVDAVQASRFITPKKSNELIKKLEKFAGHHEAGRLQREVYVAARIKTDNESIFYNVDAIHEAMAANREVEFTYYQWNVNKKLVAKRDGRAYRVSPWALCWEDENYYLIAYDKEADCLKHYRVDKMADTRVLDSERCGRESFEKFDMAVYTQKFFSMFGGEDAVVTLKCHNSVAGVIIDRFGRDIMMVPEDENHFKINIRVSVSPQFFAWVFSLGDKVRITAPGEVSLKMVEYLKNALKEYT